LFRRQIPFPIAIAIILCVSGTTALFTLAWKDVYYQYELRVPLENGDTINLSYGPHAALANADFFERVRADFVEQKANFIEVNLSRMALTVFSDGTPLLNVPILTKGRKGSWWETPAGIYQVETKETTHFSSIGRVTMPWSMQFQGNFFIHGIPTDENGAEVSSNYTGGCVRITTADAKKIFSMVNAGTPVLVFEDDFVGDSFKHTLRVPEVSAKKYLVADLKNNFVFLERGSGEKAPIASVTKLMTAVVATEYVNLDKNVAITPSMIASTSKPRLAIGKEYTAYDLLNLILLESSNEAALALSQHLGPTYFVELMNKKARALGMTHTVFTDPTGSSAGNVSTPEDLFTLARYIYLNRGFILNVSAGKVKASAYTSAFSNIQSMNGFRDNPEFIGGKVGQTTAAGGTMLAVFETPMRGEKRPIAVIVLGSDDYWKDVEILLSRVKGLYQ